MKNPPAHYKWIFFFSHFVALQKGQLYNFAYSIETPHGDILQHRSV